jgi:tetratricopeptide (TPR) repeat protein
VSRLSRDVILRGLLCSAMVATVALPCGVASAQGKPTASALAQGRTHFLRGVDLFRDQDYRAALIEFRRANEIAPSYRILYNLGQTYFELQDYVGAHDAFQGYLDQGGTQIPAARRTQVAEDLLKLEARMAYLTVTVDADGASVAVDDVPAGTTPLRAPVRVSSGERRISATLEGRGTVSRTLEVAGADQLTVNLELPRAAVPSPPVPVAMVRPAPLEAAPPPPAPSRTPMWIAGSATVGLVAATTVLGILTLGARHDYDSALDQYPTTQGAVNDARTLVRSLALATDLVGAAALIGAGTTVYFVLRPPKKNASTTALVLQPALTGATLTATF